MSISALAMQYRPIVITAVMLLMAWGVVSYLTMPRREDPEYTVRTCAVTTVWPGAPAEKVEELITDKLEEAIDTIEEVDVCRSTTMVGLSTVYVDVEDRVPADSIDNVWDKVRARVARVRMPESGITPDVNDEFGDTNVLLLAVYQTPLPDEESIRDENRYSHRQLDVISKKIRDSLRLIDGVAKSEQYGVREEAIYLETDMGTWSQLDLTTTQLSELLESRNIVAPGGSMDTDTGRYSIKPGGEFDAIDEVNSVVVGAGGDADQANPVYLTDLGIDVVRDYEDPPALICRFGDATSSESCVVVAISMKSGANIVDICNAAMARLAEMREVEQSIPPDIGITPISNQSDNVTAKIDQVVGNVIGAILIVVIVVYLVVGFRTAAVMAANIPVVVLAAIALITVFDVQLEQISLASIIIALGLLVDNAVQVCDQSRTNQIDGMRPTEATVSGANTLSLAMLNGTATTVAAFFPMLIGLSGSKQEYIYSLPVTLSVTLSISWLLAMTFCVILASAFIRAPADPAKPSAPLPMLGDWLSRMLRRGQPAASEPNPKSDFIGTTFRTIASAAVRAKWLTVGIAFALLFAALALPVGSEFFPMDRRDQFAIEVFLPDNVSIGQTDDAARQVERILQKLSPGRDEDGNEVQRIRAIRTMAGGGGARWYLGWNPEPRQPNYAEIVVRTTDGRYTPEIAKRVREIAANGDEQLGVGPVIGARVVPQELALGPAADPVAIRLMGSGFADLTALRTFADRLKDIVRSQPGTWDVNDSWGTSGFQLRVDVDEDKANLAGVSNSSLARTLNAYFSGHRLTTFREGDHQVPVYLRLGRDQRESIDVIQTAYIEGASGKVPLDAVATVTPRFEPARIERRDLNRVIEVRCQVEPGVRGNDVVNAIMKSDELKQLQSELPAGFWIEVGGSLEESQESMGELVVCLSMSLLLIVLLLVVQYNGWAKPIIILTTLPLALIGAIPGLYFTGNPLGFMPQLGILSLFGIVLNTGIIFIEFADQLIAEKVAATQGDGPICGLTREQFRNCLVEAGRMRLLPIFLTTATTVGGLFPLAVGGGPLWEGMAWCMIFGLLIATVLTLLVVPALYAVLVETFGVRPVRVTEVAGGPDVAGT